MNYQWKDYYDTCNIDVCIECSICILDVIYVKKDLLSKDRYQLTWIFTRGRNAFYAPFVERPLHKNPTWNLILFDMTVKTNSLNVNNAATPSSPKVCRSYVKQLLLLVGYCNFIDVFFCWTEVM